MSLFRFEGEDIAVGPGFALVAAGARRVLLEPLSTREAQWLQTIGRARAFEAPCDLNSLVGQLLGQGLIAPASAGRNPSAHRRLQALLRLPSRNVSRLAAPFTLLTTPTGLLVAFAGPAILLACGVIRLFPVSGLAEWLSSVTPASAVLTVASVVFATLAHELGHAAACLRLTGVAGSIRLRTYRGLPAMSADVSSLCRTDPAGRAVIGICGAAFQALFAAVLLLAGSASVRLGATIALFSAIYNAAPMPLTDGYWLVRDFLGLELHPRLVRPDPKAPWSDVAYGYFLLAATSLACMALVAGGLKMFEAGMLHLSAAPLRGVLMLVVSVWAALVAVLFVVRNTEMFWRAGAVR